MSWIKKRQRWVLDTLSLGAVLQYCAYRFLQSTMFTFYYSNTYKLITMGLLLVFGGIRYLYVVAGKLREKNTEEKRKFILYCIGAWLLALPFFYVGWKHDYKVLIFIPICCMCLYDMESEKILKAFAWTIGTLLAATIICCLSGTVRNLVRLTDTGRTISSYGVINSTDFASYITFLLLVVWCCIRKREWYFGVLFAAITACVSYEAYLFTDSRTVIICGVLIVLFSLWDTLNYHAFSNNSRWSKLGQQLEKVSIVAFPLIGAAVVALSVFYAQNAQWAVQLNELLSNRLKDTLIPFQTYGVHTFGSSIETMHGRGGTLLSYDWSSGYGYIDVAYAMLAIRYGWIITAIVTGLWVWMTAKAVKNGNNRIAFSMAILAFHAFSEARVWDVNYNVFLIMPFCSLIKPVKKEYEAKEKMWIPITSVSIIGGLIAFFLPKFLSWLRTYFSYKRWNNGTAAFNALLVCAIFVTCIWLFWLFLNRIIRDQNKRSILEFVLVLAVIIIGVTTINGSNNEQLTAWKEKLNEEEKVIQIVQKSAVQTVYAAEPEELYNRRIGGFTSHIFSTEELSRMREGSIFTDRSVEAQAITTTGGVYTQISDCTGLYTYDSEVIQSLAKKGYEWTPYYSGRRYVDLADAALFNDLKSMREIVGPARVVMSNMEIDHFAGKYEATFILSGSCRQGQEIFADLEILGEAGEKKIYDEKVYISECDTNGRCVHTIEYNIGSTPKVSYAITIPEGVCLNIEEVSWIGKPYNYSNGVRLQSNGIIDFTTNVFGNEFNLIHFQLYNAVTGEYINEFGKGNSIGHITGEYTHNYPSGLYYIRLKSNANLADEWIQKMMYLEEDTILYYTYDIEEISPNRIVVSNVKIDKAK